MSTDNTNTANDETQEQTLDDFAAELFSGSKAAPEDASSEETTETETDNLDAPEETDTVDTQTDDLDEEGVSEDDDTLATDEDEETDEGADVDPKPKKKNRFQERIDELTAARKEAERKVEEQAANFQDQINALREKLEGSTDKKTETKPEESKLVAPTAADKNEDGTPKYPLGEYDPKFMRDTVEHMFAEKEAEQAERNTVSEEQRQQQEAKASLQREWNTKLDSARERYPDFQEKGEQMLAVFEGIEPAYGEYLTNTLMEMEAGPDVFYYLASNVDEAQAIVAGGPKKATMEFAKLEAALGGQQKSQPKPRITKAKAPPPQNKGSAVARPKVAPDTDDLNAFEKELFRK